jgi:inner membrane protein
VDNLTHSLFALTLANSGLRRAGRGATVTLVIASNIPDIEVVTRLTGGRVGYLAAHRGPSHGPLGLGLALATGVLVWLALRATGRREGAASLASLVGLASLGVAGHVAMDVATSYGTRILSPFDRSWFGADCMPIAEPFLWVVFAAACVGAVVRPALRTRLAACALLLMGADYAVHAAAHDAAIEQAVAIQASVTSARVGVPARVFHYLGRELPAELPAALPTWSSLFRWRLITRAPGGFEVRTYDLWNNRIDGEPIAFPDDRGPLVDRGASSAVGRVFLDFSRLPAADEIKHGNGDTSVHFYDLRFAEPPQPGGDSRTYTSPFAVWIRLSPAGEVVGQGLGPG